MRVLVTRARDDAARTAARLAGLGHEAVIAPLIAIVPAEGVVPDGVFDAVLATSVHALTFVARLPPALSGATWLVVGERLGDALAMRGWGTPEAVTRDVTALIAAIDERYPEPFRFLYLAGRERKPDLERGLRARGHELVAVETYATESIDRWDVDLRSVDVVLHYSRRSAERFASAASEAEKLHHIAISADAAAPLLAQGWGVGIAATPDEDAMLAMLR